MSEPNHLEIFDNEGQINYDKVVEIVHLNLKNFLDAILEESFNLAKDGSFRTQLTENNSKAVNEALDAFLERKHIITSEFYVELESNFYTSSSVITQSNKIDQSGMQKMNTDLIELALAIDLLISRSVDRHTKLIEQLTTQLEELSLIANQEFNILCLHPQEFYTLFKNCIAPLNIPADGKILISKLLYQNISPNLNDFYLAMYKFLLDVNIQSNLNIENNSHKQEVGDENLEHKLSNSSIMSMSTGQFFAPVEQDMWNQEFEAAHNNDANNDYIGEQLNNTPEIIDELAMDVYGPGQTGLDETTVSLLLQPYSPNTHSNSSPAQRRQFVRALSSVQRLEAANNAIFQADQIKTAARRTLHEKGALDAEEIVDNEEKVIDFVSNIFQVILNDESICNAIKNLLARLQISTIKLALIDFTFFQNAKHPARQLLNNLTAIGISSTGNEELLFRKLNTIVESITNGFDTDIRVFELALSEIKHLDISSLEQQISKENAERNKHKLRSQRSAAKRVVIHTIKKFINNKEVPNQILEFCLKCWAPHMAYVYMNHGKSAKEWRTVVRTLRRVIEISQGTQSLQEVSQYIHNFDEFFEKICIELEHFSHRTDAFEDALEEAEVWYLTHIRKLEQEASEKEHNPTQQDNVIHLFKNLSTSSAPETNHLELEQFSEAPESEMLSEDPESDEPNEDFKTEIPSGTDDIDTITVTENEFSDVEALHESAKSTSSDHKKQINLEDEAIPVTDIEDNIQQQVHELDSSTEIDDEEFEEELDLNIAEHLPDSIVPGAWLEIYQGEDKAKRRLKFSRAIVETNYLVFSDRSGDYNFEIDLQTFLDDLSSGRSSLISESNRFDLALSSVINNIRSNQDSTRSK
jgi:hypothetical protein